MECGVLLPSFPERLSPRRTGPRGLWLEEFSQDPGLPGSPARRQRARPPAPVGNGTSLFQKWSLFCFPPGLGRRGNSRWFQFRRAAAPSPPPHPPRLPKAKSWRPRKDLDLEMGSAWGQVRGAELLCDLGLLTFLICAWGRSSPLFRELKETICVRRPSQGRTHSGARNSLFLLSPLYRRPLLYRLAFGGSASIAWSL